MAITPQYQTYLKSDKWQAKRRKVLKRAGYRCHRCGKSAPLQVHHLTYDRIFKERLSDLQAVCADCHMQIHRTSRKPGRVRFFAKMGRVMARIIG